MAGYGRRGTGRITQREGRARRRRLALNTALDAARTNSERIKVAADYAAGAVKHANADTAETTTEQLVKVLVDAGDRLLTSEGRGGEPVHGQ